MITLALLASLAAAQAPASVPQARAHADLVWAFRAADYPADAMMAGQEGRVGVSVSVTAGGAVNGCDVTRSSGSAALDAGTCRIISERVRYTPALDRAGTPVADRVSETITWALPREPVSRATTDVASYVHPEDYPPDAQILGQSGRVEFEVDVSPQGRVTSCRVMRSQAGEQLNLRTCHIMLIRARFTPARDAGGRPVADTIQSSINWVIPESAG